MSVQSPLGAFLQWEKENPDLILFHQPLHGGKRKTYTRSQAGDEIRRVAKSLRQLDLPPKSKVAILSKNCAHWIMADLAIMMAGHISVPIYPTLDADSIRQILDHSESSSIFLGKLDDYPSQKVGIPEINKIGFNCYGMDDGTSWDELVANNQPLTSYADQNPDDLISILYTSGTTGTPKGVMHTVQNFTIVPQTYPKKLSVPDNPRFFSYLPLAHVAERVGIEMNGLFRGSTFYFAESIETFALDLEKVQPHMFFAVPRIWAKFQEAILKKIPQKKLNLLTSIPIVNLLVRKKLKKKLGLSTATFIASGAAPISVELIHWFRKIGVNINQVYGMTEDCILSHYNFPAENRIGSVGKALPGVTGKISEEGEICIKNEVLMKGYYKNPDLTKEMFDSEGFLKTGDIGEYDKDGYLFITGRIKDQFKTDKGKYISPAPIELQLLKNENIELCCVVGMGIPQPIALCVLSEDGIAKDHQTLIESLKTTLVTVNKKLKKVEKLSKMVIMKADWSVDNGLLTPTLKTKRNQIEKIHMPNYKNWFNQEGEVVFE
ncbi:AMP-binding protein [Aegicerativicinus sediminis]|uniref:AMP-binding protein n=1 Tax=Aegicerativicinus sediminis TaxID=2893202 RepID=UPI001E41A841|nr:AMP-binding protein [Aegicerativicinus sediminis]